MKPDLIELKFQFEKIFDIQVDEDIKTTSMDITHFYCHLHHVKEILMVSNVETKKIAQYIYLNVVKKC